MKNSVCKKNIIHIHQLGFPINLEIIIPKDDSVRTLYEVTEGLDLVLCQYFGHKKSNFFYDALLAINSH